ncbi:MAG TPA: divalent-cation tolerance protein CutA [Planctomycetaceae bacterium]|nr:divalent-cation tolerance protein CutA [Planctomycetaceae bacterium]
MNTDHLLIATTTVSSREQADTMARSLVASQLAACVQIDGPITSHYVWQGQAEETTEWRLTIKTRKSIALHLQQKVFAMHPYDIPQWVAIVADLVSTDYGAWVQQSVKGEAQP